MDENDKMIGKCHGYNSKGQARFNRCCIPETKCKAHRLSTKLFWYLLWGHVHASEIYHDTIAGILNRKKNVLTTV